MTTKDHAEAAHHNALYLTDVQHGAADEGPSHSTSCSGIRDAALTATHCQCNHAGSRPPCALLSPTATFTRFSCRHNTVGQCKRASSSSLAATSSTVHGAAPASLFVPMAATTCQAFSWDVGYLSVGHCQLLSQCTLACRRNQTSPSTSMCPNWHLLPLFPKTDRAMDYIIVRGYRASAVMIGFTKTGLQRSLTTLARGPLCPLALLLVAMSFQCPPPSLMLNLPPFKNKNKLQTQSLIAAQH
jgi:hypothetical protein